MVSEWMEYGNIIEFVRNYEGVNPVQLVSKCVISCGDRRDTSSVGRCRERAGVYAQHSHGARRLEGGMILSIARLLSHSQR